MRHINYVIILARLDAAQKATNIELLLINSSMFPSLQNQDESSGSRTHTFGPFRSDGEDSLPRSTIFSLIPPQLKSRAAGR